MGLNKIIYFSLLELLQIFVLMLCDSYRENRSSTHFFSLKYKSLKD